jgi:hypothetical protein
MRVAAFVTGGTDDKLQADSSASSPSSSRG